MPAAALSPEARGWLEDYEPDFGPRGTSAVTVEKVPLSQTCGPARVIDARGRAELTADLFAGLDAHLIAATPRILFRTDTWVDPASFPTTWPLIDPALPAWQIGRAHV